MLNDQLRFHQRSEIDQLLKIVFGTVVLCILAPITLGAGTQVPITLQSLLIVLLPVIFGWANGAVAVLIYLVLGAIGLPVFAGYSGGHEVFLGTSGGFLFGFLIAANVVGFFSRFDFKMATLTALILLVIGQLIILFAGLFWMEGVVSEPINYAVQLEAFLPGLMIKAAIGMVIFITLSRILKRRSS